MKYVFALSLLASLSAFAEGTAANPKFDQHKQEMLSNIDKRQAALTTLKSCVQGAANWDAIKTCNAQHEEAMKDLRKAGLDERIKEMQEKRAKMDQKAPAK